MIKHMLTTLALIASASSVAAEITQKDRILARECHAATKAYHPTNPAKSYSFWKNKAFDGDFCDGIHGLWSHNRIITGNGYGCATYYDITETKIEVKGTNRFGETDNRTFTCYYVGRDQRLHTAYSNSVNVK